MTIKILAPGIGAVVMFVGLCATATPVMAQARFSADIALTSDYVWRGTSQTQENPAVQVGMGYTHASGVHASVWGSNVDFGEGNDAASEFDFVLGWGGAFSDAWTMDVSLVRYQYPSTAVDLDWNEISAGLTWCEDYTLAIAYSDDVMATGTNGTYVSLAASHAIGERMRAESIVGHYFPGDAFADDYTHGSFGLVWAFQSPFEFRTTFDATDSAAGRLFPGLAGSRLEAALQASF